MKQSDIQVGKFYCNRGRRLVLRHVVDIIPNDPKDIVRFFATDLTGNQVSTYNDHCFIDQFAKWAGSEVEI